MPSNNFIFQIATQVFKNGVIKVAASRESSAFVVESDILATNGVIHVIDTVIWKCTILLYFLISLIWVKKWTAACKTMFNFMISKSKLLINELIDYSTRWYDNFSLSFGCAFKQFAILHLLWYHFNKWKEFPKYFHIVRFPEKFHSTAA